MLLFLSVGALPGLAQEPPSGLVNTNYEGPTTPLSTSDALISDALEIARDLDPDNTAELEAAIAAGTVTLTGGDLGPNNGGVHDHDTITVNINKPVEAVAVSLIHEWIHVENGSPTPNPQGTTGDTRIADNCWVCIHAQMTIESANQMLAHVCSASLLPVDPEICRLIKAWTLLGEAIEARCAEKPGCHILFGPLIPHGLANYEACAACPELPI